MYTLRGPNDATLKDLGLRLSKTFRVRTEQGKCNYLMHKWGMVPRWTHHGRTQTIRHVAEECQKIRFGRALMDSMKPGKVQESG